MTDEHNTLNPDNFFNFYRSLHPESFSDTVVKYDLDLTPELFMFQLEHLSADMLQDAFERFVRRAACRLICPNINPGTGPNGGGDGKTDAETFPVSPDIADKWYVGDGIYGEDRWAFAMSVKKDWSPKVESDVKGIVGTNRGFTRVYFFSNQLIRSKARKDKERDLKKKYGLDVCILDGSWCMDAVFEKGCKDIALYELHFSDEYRRKTVETGPRDMKRKERLELLENKIHEYGHVEFDTDFIDDLIEAYTLSRELECPRVETEDRFKRAILNCERHGTKQQLFNIKYDLALTCLFWFKDVDAAYKVFSELKPFLKDDPSETRAEKYTNILIDLYNAAKTGLFDKETLESELKFLKDFKADLEASNDHKASLLYLNLYFTELAILDKASNGGKDFDALIEQLREYLIQSDSCMEISFETNERVLNILSESLPDNEKLSALVDDIADMMVKRKEEISAGKILLERAELNFKKKQFKDAIRRLSKCVLVFNKNGAETELVKANGFMGMSLCEENLLYSAEAYLVRAASMLVLQYSSQGSVPHLLLVVLRELMQIELRLGRLVMFLNWNELRNLFAANAQEKDSSEYRDDYETIDVAWAYLFSISDLSDPLFERLPDVLSRQRMALSVCQLKSELGWEEEIDDECRKRLHGGLNQLRTLLQTHSDQKAYLFNLNVSKKGDACIETVAGNCRFLVVYANTVLNQLIAETFLAALESLTATMEFQDLLFTRKLLRIRIVNTADVESCEMKYQNGDYVLYLNEKDLAYDKLWESFGALLALMSGNRDLLSSQGIVGLFKERQKSEDLASRLTVLMQHYKYLTSVFGSAFKYRIEDWQSDQDKVYKRKRAAGTSAVDHSLNSPQSYMEIYRISSDMSLWDHAAWYGCSFLFYEDAALPPILGLLFKNIEAGFRIFDEWKEQEKHGALRIGIVIVRHYDKNHLSWYRVCVTPGREVINNPVRKGEIMGIMPKACDMNPDHDEGKVVFLENEFKRFGQIGVAPMSTEMVDNQNFEEFFRRCVRISTVSIVEEWKIADGSWETVAVRPNDEPYIPAGMEGKAPVLELLKKLKPA